LQLIATVALCAQRPHSNAVVSALLERSRLLQDIYFRIPLPLWRRYIRETAAGPGVALPPPVPMIAQEGLYHLSVPASRKPTLAATQRLRVFRPDQCANLPVLSSAWAWEDVRLNGEPAKLATACGWLRFSPTEPGEYVVSGRVALKEATADGGSLSLEVPKTVRTLVRFDSPEAWEVAVHNAARGIRGSADKGSHGLLGLTPRKRLRLTYRRPMIRYERPPRYQLRGAVAWNLDAGHQQVRATLKVAIVGGETEQLDLLLPTSAERIRVAGPDVRDTRVSPGVATVFLRGKISGRTRLRVTYEMPLAKGSVQPFGRLGIRDGHWAGGTLVVTNSAGGSEVLASSMVGLRQLALADIPASAAAILAGPPALAYEITSRRWSAQVEVVNLGEFALRESIADLAHYQLLLRDDGTILCKATYEVRNRTRQFLRLDLPPGAVVLLARVNEQSKPLTPIPGSANAYLLPLIRSKASVRGLVSFPVEIALLRRTDALERRGEAALTLPRIDLPIAYAWCEAHVPDGIRVDRWTGPLKRVERYSSETATAGLAYGRGLAAEGYRLRARPTPKARPAPKPERKPKVEPRPKKKPPKRRTGLALLAWLGLGRKEEGAEAKPPTPPKGPSVATVAGGTIRLARNYYRAGKEFYERGDYANAAENLRQVITHYPRSPDAANARRLLSNIDLLRGKLTLKTQEEKAAGLQVRREVQAGLRWLEEQQQEQIEKGLAAAREGRLAQAKAQLQAAESLGRQLMDQGAIRQEQLARLRLARGALERIRKQEGTEVRQLRERLKQLKERGRYEEAFETAQRLRGYVAGKEEDEQKALQSELEGLAVGVAKQRLAQRRRAHLESPAIQVDKSELDGRFAAAKGLYDKGQYVEALDALIGGAYTVPRTKARPPIPRDRLEEVRRRTAVTAIGGERRRVEPWEARMREALKNKKVSFDFVETPLQDVISFLSALTEVSVVLDTEAIKEEARSITLRVNDLPLGSALNWVCKLAGLRYTLKDEAVFISRPERTYERPVLRMYGVDDLTIDIKEFERRQHALAEPEAPRGEDFFRDKDIDRPPTGPARGEHEAVFTPPRPAAPEEPERLSRPSRSVIVFSERDLHPTWETRLRRALAKKVSFDFVETPLPDVISHIRTLTKAPIVLDPRAIRGDTPAVTLTVKDLRLDSALTWVLKLVGLKYALWDQGVYITRPELIPQKLVVRIHDVSGITDEFKKPERRRRRVADEEDRLTGEGLIFFVRKTIAPGTWAHWEAKGRRGYTIDHRTGKLIVTHTAEVQEQVRRLLDNFRKAGRGEDWQRPEKRAREETYDVRALLRGETKEGKKLETMLRDAAGWSGPDGKRYTIQYRNGRIVVVHSPEVHEMITELLTEVRKARGPQVEMGSNIARQRAQGLLEVTQEPEPTRADVSARLADDDAFRTFVARNYDWQLTTTGQAGRERLLVTDLPQDALTSLTGNLAGTLEFNLRQGVDVNSVNLNVAAPAANSLGVTFVTGKNGVTYGIIDEAQLRTLVELDTRLKGKSRLVPANQRFQESIVGTDALLANGMVANVGFAGDRANTLDIADNLIKLPHENYILIDNGSYLTAVRAGAMRHWTERPAPVQFALVPYEVDVPRVGQLVKFEKTLVEPTDELVIRATYSWKGGRR